MGEESKDCAPLTDEEIEWLRAFRREWKEHKSYQAKRVTRQLKTSKLIRQGVLSGDLAECSE